MTQKLLLTLNAGSSSVKIGIFTADAVRLASGLIDFRKPPLRLQLLLPRPKEQHKERGLLQRWVARVRSVVGRRRRVRLARRRSVAVFPVELVPTVGATS